MQGFPFQLSRWLALLILLGLGWAGLASAQNADAFSVSPAQVTVGDIVTATYSYTTQPNTITLDWGDGTRDAQALDRGSAVHRYEKAGTYTVVLLLQNQAVSRQIIRVAQATACQITAQPSPAAPGQSVTITVTFTGPADSKYGLDFGDGGTNNFGTPGQDHSISFQHPYSQSGPKVVLLLDLATQRPLCQAVITVAAPVPTLSLDPNPAQVGQSVTATLGNLLAGAVYSLDWGDGTMVPATGTLKHAYSAPGVYIVKLSTPAAAAPVTASLTVRAPTPTLGVDPNSALVGQPVTASLENLLPTLSYTLDWGDGSAAPISASGKASAQHAYLAPGVYAVKLSAEGLAPVVVSLRVNLSAPTLSLDPSPADIGQSVTASLGNLAAGISYSLDWGDGTTVPATGSPKHVYPAPGVYLVKLSADGIAPVTASLTVRVPTPTLSAAPSPASVGETVTATPGTLAPGLSYTLDWGDGAAVAITGPLKHQYAAPGVYVLKLSVDGAAPATFPLTVGAALKVKQLDLHFVKTYDKASPAVLLGSRLDAALDLQYEGQGQLTGELQLDGKTLANVNLSAVRGKTLVSFPLPNLPTSDLGLHTLTYIPTPAAGEVPVSSTPPALTYTVIPVPTELEIDGFVFKITALKNPDFAALAGTASHTLIVGGVEAFRDVSVSFTNLTVESVSDERVKVTDGQIVMNLNTFKTTPLPAGLGGFTLIPASVQFTPSSADFSGQVSLAITCQPPAKPSFPDQQYFLENHPTLLDLVSGGIQQFVVDPVNDLNQKGALPVFAAPIRPISIRGQGQAVIRTASTRTLAQVGAGAFGSANLLGHSQDFRFAALQGKPPLASVVSGAALGNVITDATKYCRPDPRFTSPITAALRPDSGDLYGSTSASLGNLPVPTTPLTLTGDSALTLDLSASQTADTVAGVLAAYDSQPSIAKPPSGDAWMGLVLDKVQPGFDTARMPPTTATLRSGYTFGGDLGAGSFTDRGWTFNLTGLSLTAVENTLGGSDGAATTTVLLFETPANVAVTVTAGGFHYALTDSLARDFGKSDFSAGGGAWVERGTALDLQINSSSWNLRELSTLKPPQAGGGGIRGGVLLGDFASSVSGGLKYVGNVPAMQGGQSASSAISSAISASASRLVSGMLGKTVTGSGSASGSAGSSAGPSSGSGSFVDSSGAARLSGGVKSILGLPSASLDDGVATLNTLTFTSDGSVRFGESSLSTAFQRKSADGLSLASLSSPDFKLLGQTFNVTAAVIGRSGGGYVLGLDGKQQLSSLMPSVKTQMRYHVSGGKNLDLSLHTDAFSKQVDPNATIHVNGSDVFVALTGAGMISSSPVRASLGAVTDTPSLGLKEVPGGYELTVAGGLDTGSGASVMKVTAEALFGLTDDPYFYVKAAIDSRTPIFSVLGAFNLYGFTGGVAYNMKWPDNASIPQYALRPVKSGDHRVQIIGGLTAAFEDGNSLHFKSIFKIDTQRGFELTADGWILTSMNQGVFGSQAAQSRLLISVTGEGFDMLGCLGPQSIGGLNCNDLRTFTLAGVVDITAWLQVRIADQKFVKIGTYSNPISAHLNVPLLGGVESRGYLIFGQALENGDRRDNLKGEGLFTGYAFDARFGIAGSLGEIGWPLSCYPWARASLGYGLDIDVGLQINPISFDAAAGFHADLDVRAGCAGRDRPFANQQEIMAWNGKSLGLTLGADINGHLRAFDPIAFDGNATLHVDLPVIPTFDVSAGVSF